jgi:filamentous hemagglutinin family protein
MSGRSSLNHIYRSVWNASLGAMVAVAEVDSSAGARSGVSTSNSNEKLPEPAFSKRKQLSFLMFPLVAAMFWCGASLPAHAQVLPTGGVVVLGGATFNNSAANKLVVTTQNGAGGNHSVINWNTFSIGSGATTQFVQPNAASLSINRVVTNTPSAIFGTLSSNGQLVLVNQSGIAVGAGAYVDTAGFTASAVGMGEADAIAGRLRFAGSGLSNSNGALTVAGNIISRGGDVVLIAPSIDLAKTAVVQAQGGSVLLAAGHSVEVTGRGLEGITLQVQAPADQVLNLGTLKGDAVGIFAGSLKHSGMIQAVQADLQGGKVVLKALGGLEVDGVVDASSQTGKGGVVLATADTVLLKNGAVIDVSGATGGGQALIGGGLQGHDARISNARQTTVEAGAQIKANATVQGDGGTAIVWSNDKTAVHGSIAARGAGPGGNGGLIETSGHMLDVDGIQIDAKAANGKAGTWLLDPYNIDITNANANSTSSGTNPVTYVGLVSGTSTVSAATIASVLSSSTSVVVATTGAGTDAGDITVSSAITKTAGGNAALTLNADGSILVNAPITSTVGKLAVNLNADLSGQGVGTVSIGTGVAIASNGGAISLSAVDVNLLGTLNAGAGDVSIAATGSRSVGLGATTPLSSGGVSVGLPGMSISGAELQNITAANFFLYSGQAAGLGRSIVVDGITAANSANIGTVHLNATTPAVSGPGTDPQINFINGASSFNALDVVADAGIYLQTNVTTAAGAMSLNSDFNGAGQFYDEINLKGGVNLQSAGLLSLNATSGRSLQIGLGVGAPNANVSLTGNGIILGAAIDQPGIGATTTLDAGTGTLQINAGINNGANSLSLSGRSITQTAGAIIAGGLTTVSANGGSISLAQPGNGISQLDFGNVSATNVNVVTGIGSITQQAGAALSVSGTTNLVTGTGTVTLNAPTNNFNIVNVSAVSALLADANAIRLGNVAVSNFDLLTANGAVTQLPGATFVNSGNTHFATGTGTISLNNAGNSFSFLSIANAGVVSLTNDSTPIYLGLITADSFKLATAGNVNAFTSTYTTLLGDVDINSTGGDILLAQDGSATINSAGAISLHAFGNLNLNGVSLTAGAGKNIVLGADTGLLTATLATANVSGGGRWLTYLSNPAAAHVFGPFDPLALTPADFRQVAAPFGTLPGQATGNGSLWSDAPVVTTSLSGSVSKVFDGSTAINLTGATLGPLTGVLFGEQGGPISGPGGVLDTANTGTGKLVSVINQPFKLLGGTGAVPTYGYKITVSGNIGTVVPAPVPVVSAKATDPSVFVIAFQDQFDAMATGSPIDGTAPLGRKNKSDLVVEGETCRP